MMGAKLANPDKLCINFMGDAAIGMIGMDFETAVRDRMPILTILLNNFLMASELKVMPASTEKHRSTDLGGNYGDFAKALGGTRRASSPARSRKRSSAASQATKEGTPALLEFITEKAIDVSRFPW